MNIAILTPTFSYFSGPDRVVERQVRDLTKEGHHVTVFALGDVGIPVPDGVRIVQLGMPKNAFLQRLYRLFFFLDVPKIRKYVPQLQGFDKLICHMYPMTILAKKAKKRYGVHYNYYNMGIAYPHLFRGLAERLYMHLFLYFTKRTVRGADSATSISSFLKEELKKETGVDGDVELCRIDETRFHKKIDGAKIKKKYALSSPTLLYVGRISPHKGVHLLIKSFKIVKQQCPNAKLLIIGKPTFENYFEELKQLAAGDPNIIFAGFVDDKELPFYYAACDVYTTATLWEGFNLPAAEAQACGKPVVAFNIGAHPEVVKNGTLVEQGNCEKFAEAVMRTIKSNA